MQDPKRLLATVSSPGACQACARAVWSEWWSCQRAVALPHSLLGMAVTASRTVGTATSPGMLRLCTFVLALVLLQTTCCESYVFTGIASISTYGETRRRLRTVYAATVGMVEMSTTTGEDHNFVGSGGRITTPIAIDEHTEDDYAKRLQRSEAAIRSLEKQIGRLESVITAKKGSKSVLINYDIGDDATISSRDVATAAGVVFGVLGSIVARSVAKNFWLVGGIATGWVAASLTREEEGGALSDLVRNVGYDVAVKIRRVTFLWRTGKLSYMYFKRWEELDRRYDLMRKFVALQNFGITKVEEAKEADRKYEVRLRLKAFTLAAVDSAIEGLRKVSNARDRKDLVRKMPRPIRQLFMSKKERKDEWLRRYRVKFCGQRLWPTFEDNN